MQPAQRARRTWRPDSAVRHGTRASGYLPFAAPSLVFVCLGFFGVFAFLSIGWSSEMPLMPAILARPRVRGLPLRP